MFKSLILSNIALNNIDTSSFDEKSQTIFKAIYSVLSPVFALKRFKIIIIKATRKVIKEFAKYKKFKTKGKL